MEAQETRRRRGKAKKREKERAERAQVRAKERGIKNRFSKFVDFGIPTEIIPNVLYVGSAACAANWRAVKQYGITHVLSMAGEVKYTKYAHVKYQALVLDDYHTADIFKYFGPALRFIRHARNSRPDARILVHCLMGISRSITIIIAFLMSAEGLTLFEAYSHVKKVRPYATPNPGFFNALVDYEVALFGEASIIEDPFIDYSPLYKDHTFNPPEPNTLLDALTAPISHRDPNIRAQAQKQADRDASLNFSVDSTEDRLAPPPKSKARKSGSSCFSCVMRV